MKIAILTVPLNHNYGGNVQNFALQMILKKMGHVPVTVNYKKGHRRGLLRKTLSKIKRILLADRTQSTYPITEDEIKVIEFNHAEFIRKNINISSDYYSEEEVKHFFDKENFDAVIVGSDQVWRPKYTPKIGPFFFNFLKEDDGIIKIAYAASFGSDVWEYSNEELKLCKPLVKRFDAISVRESLGVEMCREHFDVFAEHVLDPTLLLMRNDYIDVFKNSGLPDNSGKIFNYILDSNDDKVNFMKGISESLGKELFTTYPKKTKKDSFDIHDMDNYQYPPVEAWLKSFHDADFVVTDSFHGTVFSIIFNKPFIAISNKARGSARFLSLLKIFGLENRLVSDLAEVNVSLLNASIDYCHVNEILAYFRANSLDFIKNSLSQKSRIN